VPLLLRPARNPLWPIAWVYEMSWCMRSKSSHKRPWGHPRMVILNWPSLRPTPCGTRSRRRVGHARIVRVTVLYAGMASNWSIKCCFLVPTRFISAASRHLNVLPELMVLYFRTFRDSQLLSWFFRHCRDSCSMSLVSSQSLRASPHLPRREDPSAPQCSAHPKRMARRAATPPIPLRT
jgi:hypothetical protein